MGIFTWLVRADEETLYKKVTSSTASFKKNPATSNQVLDFARSDDIHTLDSNAVYELGLADDFADLEGDEQRAKKKSPAKGKKKKDISEDTLTHLRAARRCDLDKTSAAIHVMLTGNGGSGYKSERVTALMTDTSGRHNKYYEVSIKGNGAGNTRYGSIPDLIGRDGNPVVGLPNFVLPSSTGGQFDQMTKTIAAKLRKGYKPRLVGLDPAVQARLPKRGQIVDKPVANENAADLVDVTTAKAGGLKDRLVELTEDEDAAKGGNLKSYFVDVFEAYVRQYVYTPYRDTPDEPDHLAYLFQGGEPTCSLAYGPGRVLSAYQVQEWANALEEISLDDLDSKWDADTINKESPLDQYRADELEYVKINFAGLKYFVQSAAADEHGILIYLG